MINNFPKFAKIVNTSVKKLTKGQDVFWANVDVDKLYEKYLSAFPEGTNPIFKKQTEHDCSCCKQFIRRAGAIVTVNKDGTGLNTVWSDFQSMPVPYNIVAEQLHWMVSSAEIADLYLTTLKESKFGSEKSVSADKEGNALTWNHFYTDQLPGHLVVTGSTGEECGKYKTTVQVFERGLIELLPEAVATVISLVDDNTLYRGAEHREALVQFQKAQKSYKDLDDRAKHLFVWKNAVGPASRFRNTVIGTLVQDLSTGVDIEDAVKSFETKVAPQNYKRTTALITPMMISKAMETIKELDLNESLERRYAKISDISVNDVLWVDNSVKPQMKGALETALLQQVAPKKSAADDEKNAEDVSLDVFLKTVLPDTTGMELLFKSGHLGNLMSLTAPVHPEPKQLFKWGNDFAWSYGGNVADSIKERVKEAGGNVTNAKLRISLSWSNFDDLDLHVIEPGGREIYFGAKKGVYGHLDVDMNAGVRMSRKPVENVAFEDLVDGPYKAVVHNFNKRESIDVGFTVEVENQGKLSHFSYDKAVRNRDQVHVATIHIKGGVIARVDVGDVEIHTSAVSQEKWGLTTEAYVKVNAVTYSPNYWGDNAVGNKHTFFVLDGAKNDEPTRGIYNEFLHPRLEKHRKVFEVIGDKTKCVPTEGQLSGLGFSSTKVDSFIVRVTQGKRKKLFNVKVGNDLTENKGVKNERQQHV